MGSTFDDIMLINIRIINKTDEQLHRVSGTHSGTEGAFPETFSENNIDLIQFQAHPYRIEKTWVRDTSTKTIFEAAFSYKKGSEIIRFQTHFSYTYNRIFMHHQPRMNFSWKHSAVGLKDYRAEVSRRSDSYPYNYTVDFFIQ